MGRNYIEDFKGRLSEDTRLHIHLQNNHYPPIHTDFIPVAKEAIKRANEGDWNTVIDMPNGISKPVWDIVEGLHLDTFLEEEAQW